MSASAAPSVSAPEPQVAAEVTNEREASQVLWLTNVSHAGNHFANQMVTVLYPAMMAELGFNYAQLGMLTAVRNLLGNAMQIVYGFLTPFIRRTWLLGVGNLGIALGSLATAMAGSFGSFFIARTLTSTASSAQHPVGMSLLSTYFPKRRGMILALNNSVANIGSLLAPIVASVLLVVMGWRQVFMVVALFAVVVGAVYFWYSDRVGNAGQAKSRKARLARGWSSYSRVLKHRNILVVSLVMMAGAAGRGDGVQTYLGPHLAYDLLLSPLWVGVAVAAMQAGSIIGPIVMGWLSDRVSRKGVLQVSLLTSAAATWWLAYQSAQLPALLLSLFTFGSVTTSRNSLTQALIADSLADQDRDAAFSVYYFIGFISEPLWSLLGGVLMEGFGFEFAFSRLAVSYLLGMILATFIVDPRGTRERAAA